MTVAGRELDHSHALSPVLSASPERTNNYTGKLSARKALNFCNPRHLCAEQLTHSDDSAPFFHQNSHSPRTKAPRNSAAASNPIRKSTVSSWGSVASCVANHLRSFREAPRNSTEAFRSGRKQTSRMKFLVALPKQSGKNPMPLLPQSLAFRIARRANICAVAYRRRPLSLPPSLSR